MPNGDSRSHRGTYVLTYDLGRKSELFRHIGLKTLEKTDPFFNEVREGLKGQLKAAYPDADIRIIDMEVLASDVLSCAKRLLSRSVSDGVIISTCSEIAAPVRGLTLEVNRLVDHKGEILTLGPRPGNPPLDEQIRGMTSIIGDRPAVVIEDGSFTGGTLSKIVSKLLEARIAVKAIVSGFAFPGAKEKISECFKGEFITIEEMGGLDLIDWIPDHDLFPFWPNCGRVLGVEVGEGGYHPFFTYDGFSYSFPYIVPFSPMQKWASIPPPYDKKMSSFCLELNQSYFRQLEKLNGCEITVGDMLGTRPRISFPIMVGAPIPPGQITCRVEDCLRKAKIKIWE